MHAEQTILSLNLNFIVAMWFYISHLKAMTHRCCRIYHYYKLKCAMIAPWQSFQCTDTAQCHCLYSRKIKRIILTGTFTVTLVHWQDHFRAWAEPDRGDRELIVYWVSPLVVMWLAPLVTTFHPSCIAAKTVLGIAWPALTCKYEITQHYSCKLVF